VATPLHARGDVRAAGRPPCITGRVTRDDRLVRASGRWGHPRIGPVACGRVLCRRGAAALQEWRPPGRDRRLGVPVQPASLDGGRSSSPSRSRERPRTPSPPHARAERGCPVIAVTNMVGSAIVAGGGMRSLPSGGPRDRGGQQDVRAQTTLVSSPPPREGARDADEGPSARWCAADPQGGALRRGGAASGPRRYVDLARVHVGRGASTAPPGGCPQALR
jgi:hypothetical protein